MLPLFHGVMTMPHKRCRNLCRWEIRKPECAHTLHKYNILITRIKKPFRCLKYGNVLFSFDISSHKTFYRKKTVYVYKRDILS